MGRCIYCGATTGPFSKEHIIPYAAGGRWTLPSASCAECARATSAAELAFSRTMLGPLRMLYDLPTRNPNKRPKTVILRAKFNGSDEWEDVYVDRSICPFLVTMPLYPLPSILTGQNDAEGEGSATNRMWIRGANFGPDVDARLEWMCQLLQAGSVMPISTTKTEPFCLTIAKVAHSFAVAELGAMGFRPYLCDMIRTGNLAHMKTVLGGGEDGEPPASVPHELEFDRTENPYSELVVVKVRLFAFFGTPTYRVVVGSRSTP